MGYGLRDLCACGMSPLRVQLDGRIMRSGISSARAATSEVVQEARLPQSMEIAQR